MTVKAWILTAAIFAGLAAFIALRLFLYSHSVFPSRAMEPTIKQGELIVVRRVFDPCGRPPARGDVIKFKFPPEPETSYMKRLIAFGGETVELRGTSLVVDGKPQDDPHASYATGTPTDFPPTRVPPGRFFVLGDNRNRSSDSRVWGPVPCENVTGVWLPAD